jgi:hypothetical protein
VVVVGGFCKGVVVVVAVVVAVFAVAVANLSDVVVATVDICAEIEVVESYHN